MADCPKCKKTALYPAPEESFASGEEMLTCPRCRGHWVRRGALGRLAEKGAPGSAEGEWESGRLEADGRTGLCPEGHGLLIRARVWAGGEFFLERCTACGGIWFDDGEWRRVATHHLLESLPDLWTEEYQRHRREEEAEEAFLDWARDRFGEELYRELLGLADRLARHPFRSEVLAFLRERSTPRSLLDLRDSEP